MNAVDITTIDEDQLLSALGKGDWLVQMPDDYAHLLLSRLWRDEQITTWVGITFATWVLNEKRHMLTHEYDPPWDSSGLTETMQVSSHRLLDLYDTLMSWLENEYTGQSTATFSSGCGLYWETYGDWLEQHIQQQVTDLFRMKYAAALAETDLFDHPIWDVADLVILALERALWHSVAQRPTIEIWNVHERVARHQRAEQAAARDEQMAEHGRKQTLVVEFWNTHFPHLLGVHMDYPHYVASGIEERLQTLFLDANPDVIEAIQDIGLPGLCSNKVSARIKKVAQSALGE